MAIVYRPKYGDHGEQNVIRALLEFMDNNGWEIAVIDDGEDEVTIKGDINKALDVIFGVTESRLFFKKGKYLHWVLIVLGNSPVEAIADYNYRMDKANTFGILMDEFTDEENLAKQIHSPAPWGQYVVVVAETVVGPFLREEEAKTWAEKVLGVMKWRVEPITPVAGAATIGPVASAVFSVKNDSNLSAAAKGLLNKFQGSLDKLGGIIDE